MKLEFEIETSDSDNLLHVLYEAVEKERSRWVCFMTLRTLEEHRKDLASLENVYSKVREAIYGRRV